MARRTIHSNAYYTVTQDWVRGVTEVTRLSTPLVTLTQLREVHDDLLRVLRSHGVRRLVFDLRQAPPVSIREFESAMRNYARVLLVELPQRSAFVVATQTGLRRVRELNDLSGMAQVGVFLSSAEAAEYVCAETP